jgi:hypothetical protein
MIQSRLPLSVSILSLTTAIALPHSVFASIANNMYITTSVNTPVWIIFNGTTSSANDTLNFVVRAMPMHGTLSNQLENAILYTPKAGFIGTDLFQYISFDRNLAQSKIATVFITIKR